MIKGNTYRYRIELETLKEVKDFIDQLLKIRSPSTEITELIDSLTHELEIYNYQ